MRIKRGGFIDKLTDKVLDMEFMALVALVTTLIYFGILAVFDGSDDKKEIKYNNVVVIVNDTMYDINCRVDNGFIERVVNDNGTTKTTIKYNNDDKIICETKNLE